MLRLRKQCPLRNQHLWQSLLILLFLQIRLRQLPQRSPQMQSQQKSNLQSNLQPNQLSRSLHQRQSLLSQGPQRSLQQNLLSRNLHQQLSLKRRPSPLSNLINIRRWTIVSDMVPIVSSAQLRR